MTGALDEPLRQAALDILNELGVNVTYRRVTRTLDPETRRATTTTSDNTVLASPPIDVKQTRFLAMPEGLAVVRNGDAVMYTAAKNADVTPDTVGENDKDQVLWSGVYWDVVTYAPMWSGNQVAAYELLLRRSGA